MPDYQHTIVPKSSSSQGNTPQAERAERSEPQEVTLAALQKQFGTIASEVGELARLVRGGAKGAVATAVDRVDDVREDTAERARDIERQAAEWIKARPMEATLLSMGIGAVLWSLLKRS